MNSENKKKTLTKKQLISLALAFILLIGLCAVAINFDKVEETTTQTTTEETTIETTQEVTEESTTEPITESTTKEETTTTEVATTATTAAATTTTVKVTTTTQQATTTTAKATTTTQQATTTTTRASTTTTQATTTSSTVSAAILAARAAGCTYCGSSNCDSLYASDKWGYATIDSELCSKYSVYIDPTIYCQTCNKSLGDGSNGTCGQYIIDTKCISCGEAVYAHTCHYCS